MHAPAALRTVFATGAILGVSYGMFGSVVPVFAKDSVGATYSEIAWIGAAYFVPYMFVPMAIGLLLVRYNNSYLLVGGVILNALSIYLLSAANSTTEIAAYRMMTGTALSMFWPSCQAIISNVGREEDRAKNLSKFTMFYVLGFMVGPLIGSVLVDSGVDHRTLFQIAAAVMAAAMISVLTKSHSHVRQAASPSLRMFGQFVRYPVVLVMISYCAVSFGAVLAVYPAFLSDSGIGDGGILLLYFVFGSARAGTLAVATRLSRHQDATLIGTAFATSAGLMISYMSDSMVGFAVAMLFLGFGFSVFFPFMLNLVLSRVRRTTAGALIGAYEAIFGIGWAVGPILAGYGSEAYGTDATYVAFSVFGAAVGVAAIVRRRSLMPQ